MVDIITITAGIAIILVVADDRANRGAQDAAYGRTCSSANAWKD